jgi:hypothetical protein
VLPALLDRGNQRRHRDELREHDHEVADDHALAQEDISCEGDGRGQMRWVSQGDRDQRPEKIRRDEPSEAATPEGSAV